MDTIPSGFRLVAVGPLLHHHVLVEHPAPRREPPPAPWPERHFHRWEAEAKNILERLRRDVSRYNRLVHRLPRASRARSDLLKISLLLSESPHIAVATPPSLPLRSPRERVKPASRADLRAEARRNKTPLPMLWERFPPENAVERVVMQKELTTYWQRQRPKLPAGSPASDFAAYLREQAKAMARARKDPALYIRLLSDPNWKAKQKADFDAITSIELDI